MKLVLLALLPALASAACPNACSGHGDCGKFDMCTCFQNWVGGDCSQRQCLSGWSWLTTAQGDLNYDGDVDDATIYDSDHTFKSTSIPYVATQHSPGGAWESYPSYHATSGDEGHFYMECSNRGICDRESGVCECFDGYTGEACRRTVCPNDCNGHGQCQDVWQQATDASKTYKLWDAYMSRSCVCDPGFTGPDCSQRQCPRGDDPLTTGQHAELQIIEVRSQELPDHVTGQEPFDKITDGRFTGSIKLTYTDAFGQAYTTQAIDVQSLDARVDSAARNKMASDMEAAIEALPNSVFTDVDVEVGYCETPLPGALTFTAGAAATDEHSATFANTGSTNFVNQLGSMHSSTNVLRCAGSTVVTKQPFLIVDKKGFRDTDDANAATPTANAVNRGILAIEGIADNLATVGTEANYMPTDAASQCYKLASTHCVRFYVQSVSNPGDLTNFVVDHSNVVIKNQLTAQDETLSQGATTIVSTASDQTTVGYSATDGTRAAYTRPSQGTITIDSTDGTDDADEFIEGGSKQIDCAGTACPATSFFDGERIKVTCVGTEASHVTRLLGTYTVASADGASVTVDENFPTAGCNWNTAANPPAATGGGYNIKIERLDNVLRFNGYIGGPAWNDAGGLRYTVRKGRWIDVQTSAGVTMIGGPKQLKYDPDFDTSTHKTHIIIDYKDGEDMHSADVAETAGQIILLAGKGTTEDSECSDRGVCDTDEGLCKCFGGYTGLACNVQNSLAA